MKKLILLTLSLFGWLAVAATAAETSGEIKVEATTNAYVKKDKAYWTRVWYEKQAKKGKIYKNSAYYKEMQAKKSAAKVTKVASSTNAYGGGRVLAKVDLSQQRMKVYRGGKLLYNWPVSTGRAGYRTPTGTWRIHRMHKRYYSRKYDNAPMPYAMFYYRGFAVHGTSSIKRLGRPASHGCVRLHPSNAATLFSLVKRNGGTVKVVR